MTNEIDNLCGKVTQTMNNSEVKKIEHEICNSLNVIIGFSDIAENNDISSRSKSEYLKQINLSAKRLLDFTNQFLDRKSL